MVGIQITAPAFVVMCRNLCSRYSLLYLSVQPSMHFSAPLAPLQCPGLPTSQHLLGNPAELARPDSLDSVACACPDSPPMAQHHHKPLHPPVDAILQEPRGVGMQRRAPHIVFEHREVIGSDTHSQPLLLLLLLLLLVPPPAVLLLLLLALLLLPLGLSLFRCFEPADAVDRRAALHALTSDGASALDLFRCATVLWLILVATIRRTVVRAPAGNTDGSVACRLHCCSIGVA